MKQYSVGEEGNSMQSPFEVQNTLMSFEFVNKYFIGQVTVQIRPTLSNLTRFLICCRHILIHTNDEICLTEIFCLELVDISLGDGRDGAIGQIGTLLLQVP